MVLVLGAMVWLYSSFLVAAVIVIAVYAAGGFALHRAGVNMFGRQRKVEHRRRSTYHTCIKCEQLVKELHETV